MDFGLFVPIGFAFFIAGLVLAHIVVGITRRSVRKDGEISSKHRKLMWVSIILALLGIISAGVGLVFADQ